MFGFLRPGHSKYSNKKPLQPLPVGPLGGAFPESWSKGRRFFGGFCLLAEMEAGLPAGWQRVLFFWLI